MTPESRGAFERGWPDVAVRLQRFLARSGVPEHRRDDVVQETGLRLLLMWESVDRSRPLWVLAKTIALNLLRDESRRASRRHTVSDVPDVPARYDLEAAGLARVELRKVEAALADLPASQRAALLREIGQRVPVRARTHDAEKMLRLRARRSLGAALKRLPGFGIVRDERWGQIGHALFAGRDGVLNALTCVVCLVFGFHVIVPGAPGRIVPGAEPDARPAAGVPASVVDAPLGSVIVTGGDAKRGVALIASSPQRSSARRAVSARGGAEADGSRSQRQGLPRLETALPATAPASESVSIAGAPAPAPRAGLPDVAPPGAPGGGGGRDDGPLVDPERIVQDAVEDLL